MRWPREQTFSARTLSASTPPASIRRTSVTIERTGEAFELDEQLTVIGRKLQPGDTAPEFALDHWDGSGMQSVRLADTSGKVRLLNIVNSLDTPVCEVETRRWERLRNGLPADVVLYTVSMDLPWAMARWSSAEGVSHQGLSSHRDDAFGRDYGVLIKEWRLLQRAVVVIGRDDTITYAEYVADQMLEPDYDAAVAATRAAIR
jgi:thioredoxin-dependent peroxiredoxin